jgi:glycosyltransferase involved in cell wall biosynthesis
MAATAAIFHHPDVIESADKPLAGRRAAGQSFLSGYVRHVDAKVLHCAAARRTHLDHFQQLVQAYGWTGQVQGCLSTEVQKLGELGVFMVPGPSLASFAWQRRRVGQRSYSLCGITHTVATKRIMDGLADMLAAPVESWDAVICTSRAVQSVVATQLDEVEAFLTRRFGARRVPRPALPVIPLGIDTDRFARTEEVRLRLRKQFEIGEDDIAVMSMGRLTVSEKMHPGPLFLALQRAASDTGKRVVLLMAGWFQDDATEKLHKDMASEMAPDVVVMFPDGKDEDIRKGLWSAADIFALPVDNIQETFGLVPVEAMAAGLPVVCSDWNGFKDTVAHGETGLRVRTFMARPGAGEALAHRFEDLQDNYHQYLVSVHQRTAIDVREMAEAFATLIGNADLRHRMGEAGVARARALYDWSAVIPQYQALWAEMNARRMREHATSGREAGDPANPAAIDPFTLYARYPTSTLPTDVVLSAKRAVTEAELEHIFKLTGGFTFQRMVARASEMTPIINLLQTEGPLTYADLTRRVKASSATLESAILWLMKFDLVQVEP